MKDLKLHELTIGYDFPLVNNIDLSVSAGKMIALLGDNGSGKTTLMKTLLNIIPPINGNISFKDKNINNFRADEWSEVFSAVFSRMGNIPEIKVNELIRIGAKKHNENYEKDVISWLNIADLSAKYANEISDGQLQKVMIARALIQDTPYVIFDEPTAHLDYKNKNKVFELLQNLVGKSSKTFIIITHEILQALYLSDEIWLLQDQQLFSGTAAEINDRFNLENEVLKITQNVRN